MSTKLGIADMILCSTTWWDGYGVRHIMVDMVGYLSHEYPSIIHGIQVAREEL
jgi:hypothetical protein